MYNQASNNYDNNDPVAKHTFLASDRFYDKLYKWPQSSIRQSLMLQVIA